MSLWEQFNKAKNEISQKVLQESKDTGEIMRLKSSISGNEQRIKQLYTDIGEAYYRERKDAPDPFVKELIAEVSRLLTENAESKKRISTIKGKVVCPECGFENLSEAKFCGGCGARLPEIIPEPEPAPPEEIICPVCGAKTEQGMRFCMNCGSPMSVADEAKADLTEEGDENAEELSAHQEAVPEADKTGMAREDGAGDCGVSENCDNAGETPVGAMGNCGNAGETPAGAMGNCDNAGETPADAIEKCGGEEKSAAECEHKAEAANAFERESIRQCPACGAEIESGDMFCMNCGQRLKEEA